MRTYNRAISRLYYALTSTNGQCGTERTVAIAPSMLHLYAISDGRESKQSVERRSIEVGIGGNEGMAGIPFILGMWVSGVRAIVRRGGSELRMASGLFGIALDRERPLQEALIRC